MNIYNRLFFLSFEFIFAFISNFIFKHSTTESKVSSFISTALKLTWFAFFSFLFI